MRWAGIKPSGFGTDMGHQKHGTFFLLTIVGLFLFFCLLFLSSHSTFVPIYRDFLSLCCGMLLTLACSLWGFWALLAPFTEIKSDSL